MTEDEIRQELTNLAVTKNWGKNTRTALIEAVDMIEQSFNGEFYKQRQTWNSPTFAYVAVYGKEPDEPLRGRTEHPERTWQGMQVDEHLKDEWLDAFKAIEGIEIRATCEGHDENRVAYVVFRFDDPKWDKEAEATARKLNGNEGLCSLSDTGAEDRPRIVVAGKTWYGQENWEDWWDGLAEKIESVISEKSVEKTDEEFTKTINFIRPTEICEGEDCDISLRKAEEKQIVYGVVYEPYEEDVQGDYATPEDIEKAAHTFLEEYNQMSLEHERLTSQAKVVESFIAPKDLMIGNDYIKKGSWVLATHIIPTELWQQVKNGEISGYSMEGTAERVGG